MNYPKVIAISGASGSGKTSIIRRLTDEFNCPYLLFDDYIKNDTYPKNMKSWLEHGADVSLIKTPDFATSLQELILKSNSLYIFIEEPFGKERDCMSALVDYVVLLDQPLELCLTRIIKRHVEELHPHSLSAISGFLDRYEEYFRDIYLSTVKQVSRNSDLTLNDLLSIEDSTSVISHWLRKINE